MPLKFIQYPKCTTCKKAQKWLEENNIAYESIHIVEQTPTQEQLTNLYKKSGLPLKKFFKHQEISIKSLVSRIN